MRCDSCISYRPLRALLGVAELVETLNVNRLYEQTNLMDWKPCRFMLYQNALTRLGLINTFILHLEGSDLN